MFVIFLDMEYDRSCQLHLGQKVEITKDEEHLALGFELSDHELLVSEEVLFLIFVGIHVLIGIGLVCDELIASVLTVPKREDLIATLNNEEREVEIGQLEVDIADLTDRLSLLSGRPSTTIAFAIVELLSGAALIDRHFELLVLCASLHTFLC